MRAFVLLRRVELWDARVVDVLTVEPGTVVVELEVGLRLFAGGVHDARDDTHSYVAPMDHMVRRGIAREL